MKFKDPLWRLNTARRIYNMKFKDPLWRLNNLYSIVNKDGQKVQFKENVLQSIVNRTPEKRKMILKARQFGISTNELLKQFDATLWTRNFTACILAHEKDAIEKLFRIPLRAYKFMDPRIRPRLDRGGGSKFEMYFPDINSRIYCDLESRGDTIQWLHVSESAFADVSKIKSTMQAVPINGIVTEETTPNGMGNPFYEKWNDPNHPAKKIFFPWFIFPDYRIKSGKLQLTDDEMAFLVKAKRDYGIDITHDQIAFRRMKQAELKADASELKRVTFEQEYPEDDQTCFLSSGNAVMDLHLIKKLMDAAPEPIVDKGWMRLYEKMDKTKTYVIGADTAEGVGNDFSVGVIININTRRVAGIIRGHWKPFEFAHKLVELSDLFKAPGKIKPMIAVERNNHGHAVLLELYEHINYENLYRHDDEKLGWKTDMVTRPVMINTFIHAVENNSITINDRFILVECLTLINDEGKIEAAEGKHDDCIFATAIAIQLLTKSSNLDIYSEIDKKILL